MKNLIYLILFIPITCSSQELFRYNFADTIMEKITTPYFLSEKLIYFDTSYTQKGTDGTFFKIGKVCEQFGCVGKFDTTGAIQAHWQIVENKIIICFASSPTHNTYKVQMKIWRWDNKIKKFILIL